MNSRTIIAPESLEELQERIVDQSDSMSNRLRVVGEFFVHNPNTVGLENMVSIAGEIGVSPSTLVRFANFLGYRGFSDLQELYRGEIRGQVTGYRERVRSTASRCVDSQNGHHILETFSDSQCSAIKELNSTISAEAFEQALTMMNEADTIYVTGVRRAFPVTYYLAYALLRADFNVIVLDDVGGLHKSRLKRLNKNDLVIAVSFHPHASETTECIQLASKRNCPVLMISGHSIHPEHALIEHTLKVSEAEMMGMRSLTTSMHLAQCLVMGLLHRQEKQ